MQQYLKLTEIIDWQHPDILYRAKTLSGGEKNISVIAKECFEWVRDTIKHIDDYNIQTVSCSASEVLHSGSGICYAKSHLLAALLRANNIPGGFCYQRLSRDDDGPPFCLHGFNAVYLPEFGWYRIDSRGNKAGVNAQFSPPVEQLAYSARIDGEIDFPDILTEPLPIIIETLRQYQSKDDLWNHLPDSENISCYQL
ncbi:MAG: transglutaminase family protein [Proteobacteria bacterium]|nr:transglutaminase family protein [Pseudomonadota bacterium]